QGGGKDSSQKHRSRAGASGFPFLLPPQPGHLPVRELIQLTWSDCQRVGEETVALRIKGKRFSGFQLVFSWELLTWQLLSKRAFASRYQSLRGGEGFDEGPRAQHCPVFKGLHSR